MITEIVEIEVKPGEEAAFEAAVAQAIAVSPPLQGLPRHGASSHHREALEIPALRQVGDAGRPHRDLSRLGEFPGMAAARRPLFRVAARRRTRERCRRRVLSKIKTNSPFYSDAEKPDMQAHPSRASG